MLDKSVLIVDDDSDILKLFYHYLKEVVKEVDTLEDSREALNRLKYKKYDLVITDILMPYLNGIELTKLLRAQYPDLPILVSSEGGTTDAKEIVAGIVMNKAITFGALYALKKPFKKSELLEVVEAMLNKRLDEYLDNKKAKALEDEKSSLASKKAN